HLCVVEKRSVYAIAELLTREGVPTFHDQQRGQSSGRWQPSTIAGMLHNTAYIGTLYDGKTQRLPGSQNPDKKTRVRRVPREEWIARPVPAILDEATFEAAQGQLQRNQKLAARNRKHAYLLGGARLRCGQCGRTMTGSMKWGVRYYCCSS